MSCREGFVESGLENLLAGFQIGLLRQQQIELASKTQLIGLFHGLERFESGRFRLLLKKAPSLLMIMSISFFVVGSSRSFSANQSWHCFMVSSTSLARFALRSAIPA